MGLLSAAPTQAGFTVLNSELQGAIQRFVLIGHASYENPALDGLLAGDLKTLTYEQLQPFVFFTHSVQRTHYDEQGVLTFSLFVPFEEDLQKTIYAIGLITQTDEGETPTLMSLA